MLLFPASTQAANKLQALAQSRQAVSKPPVASTALVLWQTDDQLLDMQDLPVYAAGLTYSSTTLLKKVIQEL